MNVLVLGSGGREHALFLKIKSSPLAGEVYMAPGNGGIAAENKIADGMIHDVLDFEGILKTVDQYNIEMLVVGPEVPLAAGIKDYFQDKRPRLMVFGPDKNSAQLEASKVFSFEFMEKANIPTAKSAVASNLEEALATVEAFQLPVVIKADGLAAGKGVSIHQEAAEARERCQEIFNGQIFGEAGSRVLIQEFMPGKEASLFALCDGKEAIYLPTACDYKRAFDNGQGPNTGGMGSFSPGNILTPEHIKKAHSDIVQKVLDEFQYTGVLYVGLMINGDDLSVVEFNCRLGDPETQCVLPMMESDLLPYLIWSCGGGEKGSEEPFRIQQDGYRNVPAKPGYCINVVLAAKGYPSSDYQKEISLQLPEQLPDNLHLVHAGTKVSNGRLLSSGGRILSVVAYDKIPEAAQKKVYEFIESLKKLNDFSKLHYRLDIGR